MSEFIRRVMSGEDRSLRAQVLRAAAALVEPGYAGMMALRNRMYDRAEAKRVGRPVVSVGNLTTGGTGKTPMVKWLVGRLKERGKRPAVLMRGYRAGTRGSDEERLLARETIVQAGGDRLEGARRVLAGHPEVDLFVLDDGFQHRRVEREFDLVLLNATEPFGFGHVLPRGMLRESLAGLQRADAVVLTRSDQVSEEVLADIERRVRQYHPQVPIYRAMHAQVGLRSAEGGVVGMNELHSGRFFAFAGIGDPVSLEKQLHEAGGGMFAGGKWFADHHDYSLRDLDDVAAEARKQNAGFLVTTEKDWVKLSRLDWPGGMGIYWIEMEMRFAKGDEDRLLEQILLAAGNYGGG